MTYVRVLEADPDLALDLSADATARATAALVAPQLAVEWTTQRGRWGPREPDGHLGLLVLDGLLLREVDLLGTPSAELIDLLRPWDVDGDAALPVRGQLEWRLLAPVTLAVLNAAFVRRAAEWPEVLARLAARAIGRAKSLALHDAISNMKHVETRLLVQFWHLSERWGRVGRETIALHLPLTHEMLAKLVGATRPPVSTALSRLAERGLLTRDHDGVWQLRRDAGEALAPMPPSAETALLA